LKDFAKKFVTILAIAFATLGGMIAVAYIFFALNNSTEDSAVASGDGKQSGFWGGVSDTVSQIDSVNLKVRQSYLDGTVVAEDLAEKPVVVMVENHPFARPQQSGLASASLVREALTEGGITRFMLVFTHDYPERVGPVRSARPYFVGWASELGGIYAHAGGSEEALSEIYRSDVLINADEDATGMSRDLDYEPPHNLFLDVAKLADKNFTEEDWRALGYSYFEFCPVLGCHYTTGISANKISARFSLESSYDVEFRYDLVQNAYIRKQKNLLNGETIAPKNLIIQYASSAPISDDDKGRIEIAEVGTGQAELFVDGRHFLGSWRKDSVKGRTIFYDPETLEEWVLEPGQTWIMVLDSPAQVTVE